MPDELETTTDDESEEIDDGPRFVEGPSGFQVVLRCLGWLIATILIVYVLAAMVFPQPG